MPASERVAAFILLLKIDSGIMHRDTGTYEALTKAAGIGAPITVVLLTDLERNTETLLEAASVPRK